MTLPIPLHRFKKVFEKHSTSIKETMHVLWWVWQTLVPDEAKFRAKMMLAGLLIATILLMAQPLAVTYIVNGLVAEEISTVYLGVGLFIGFLVFQLIFDWQRDVIREKVWNPCIRELYARCDDMFYRKTIGQHILHSNLLNHASLERARNETVNVQEMMLFDVSVSVIRTVTAMVLLWWLSPVAGLIMSIALIIHLLWSFYLNYEVSLVMPDIDERFRAHRRETAERWEKVIRVITNGRQTSEQKRLSNWLQEILRDDLKLWTWFSFHAMLRESTKLFSKVLILGWGVYLVMQGAWEVGYLYSLVTWSATVSESLWQLGHYERRITDHVYKIKNLKEGFEIEDDFSMTDGIELERNGPLRISFENVGLAYPVVESNGSGKFLDTLRDVSFTMEPGEKVALIGPSGAGKSSVMKLLLRFQDPASGAITTATSGVIKINDIPLTELHHQNLMQQVGYIPQKDEILNGTIRYNLLYGLSDERREQITDEQLWELMRKLQIDFGDRLTEGLDTLVGRDGLRLSGGQAQRLMIGAAVIKEPRLMVIDEATSSLDSETEHAVQTALSDLLTREVTAFIISHRFSTVRDCDRFLYLAPLSECSDSAPQIQAVARSLEELCDISPEARNLAQLQGLSL